MDQSRKTTLKKLALILFLLLCLVLAVDHFSDPRPAQPRHLSQPKTSQSKKPKPFMFPQGGRMLLPEFRLVALYGTPETPALGALGEQAIASAETRVKKLARQYQPLSRKHIYPTFEIIASVASAKPTENGDYSQERPLTEILPWVLAAKKAGIYVLLDLQPGRSDFLTQAKEYEPLLRQPNVGLALDPEWRLGANQFHLNQIGRVSSREVNATSRWLAELTAERKLPQKLFLLHQFRLSMIENRQQLDTSRPQLAYIIQVDGQGRRTEKQASWDTLTARPPPNVSFGWKNFYDEDSPLWSASETMKLKPVPNYISYQ